MSDRVVGHSVFELGENLGSDSLHVLGRLAQSEERHVHIVEVMGSRPISPTNSIKRLIDVLSIAQARWASNGRKRRMVVKIRWQGVVVAALFATTVGLLNAPLLAYDVDEGFSVPDRADDGYQGVTFRDSPAWEETYSWLMVNGEPCESLTGNCMNWLENSENPRGEFHAILGPCISSSDQDCIEKVVRVLSGGLEVEGEFRRSFPTRGMNDFTGLVSEQIPNGGPAGLWEFPGVVHSGGSQYFVRIGMRATLIARSAGRLKVDPSSVTIHGSIYATEEIPGPCQEDGKFFCGPRNRTYEERISGSPLRGVLISPWIGRWSKGPSDCVMTGEQKCLQRLAMSPNSEFRVILRLSRSPSGWFHGRLVDPSINLQKSSTQDGVRMTFSGKSVAVPVIAAGERFSDLPESIQSQYLINGRFRNSPNSTRNAYRFGVDPLVRNSTSQPLPDGQDSQAEFELWRNYLGDKSTADLQSWSFRAMSVQSNNQARSCFQADGTVKGIVAVDSLTYSPGPPDFVGGSLIYTVSAPHYTSGGSVRRGSYQFNIRSDVARCVYGFSSAPVQATISVLDSDGTSEIATTNVSESGGWLKLVAKNFDYSAPRIKVTLTQQTASSSTPASRKRTIVCSKGVKRIRVTGVSPRCPKGYRKA